MRPHAIPHASRRLQLLVAGLALGIAMAALVMLEYLDARRDVLASLQTQARVVTDGMLDALIFADAEQAQLRLDALSGQPVVGAAELYRYDSARGSTPRLLARHAIDEAATNNGGLFDFRLATPIAHEGIVLGELRMVADSGAMTSRLARYAATLLLVAALAFALALMLTGGLRRRIAAAEYQLSARAHLDDLTGLPNRRVFNDGLDAAITTARRTNLGFAVLFCDLDRFKEINDSLGHETGDRLLAIVGARLRAAVRDRDTVCRLGGDEFVALAEHCDAGGAERIAHHIIDRLSEPYAVDNHTLTIGVSIGIALYPEDGRDTDDLLRAADTAVYAAKTSGRGICCFFSRELATLARERVTIETGLRHALATDQFRLCYQPRVDAATRRVCGAEALLRWTSPELGDIPPRRLIPVAEQSDLMGEIGAWVLEQACRDAAAWIRDTPGFTLAVNLSARQLRAPDFAEQVGHCLKRHGIAPERLELEISESALLAVCDQARATLFALAALGVTLSLDDFGSGWSSLGRMRELPIARVKIDSAFVHQLPLDTADDAVVRAIVALAAAFGLKVVAEGVETEDQFGHLVAAGCNGAEGWLFGREVSAHEFAASHLGLH